ncbi:unnamed protein product [Rotaria sordida]|uniref:protein-serine/threonine phosphatase n=1 Tax=Rotaria sordida TaxID=392033 RepID=A0A814KAJ9_9BILA|nr:unnamed protein product [Rotaria sordida]CAF1048800.1 unnamed protein product [Rotaria sordida]
MFQKKLKQKIANIFLNNSNTRKELDHGQSFAFGGMQGWRISNEDIHKHLVPIDHHSWKLWSYFAIFDGHNGIDTAKYAADLLDKYLIDTLNQTGINSNDESIHSSQIDKNQLNHIIKKTFLQLDKKLANLVNDQSGSVCITSLIGPKYIYLINVGDARAIIISNDGQVLAYTKDHKPNVIQEQERIHKAGGRITQYENDVARVEDKLAVSRTFGDYSLDKRLIPALPDIIQYRKDSLAAFVILACDGIWDVMTNEQVALFVSQKASNTSLENIASQLLDQCLKLKTSDNMSIYIIKVFN